MTHSTNRTLYVHVPFCVVKCGYCDFNSYADGSRDAHATFLRALDDELALLDPWPDDAQPPSVFVGGGTPTYLAPDHFAELFAVLGRHVDLQRCPEVSIEANPESVTEEKIRCARAAGVKRFSLGAQSFTAERLKFLDRAHDADGIRKAFATLRAAGADNVSVDLMFGLPGQSLKEWTHDLDAALELSPDHISCYNLTFEPGTQLEHARQQGRVSPNDPDDDLELFSYTRGRLAKAGFDAYEISNFAGRGGPCHHNDHYWLQGDYEGVGPGAASHVDGRRATNLKVVGRWADTIAKGERPFGDSEHLSPEQRAGEALWLGLRRRDGVDLAAISSRLGLDLQQMFRDSIAQWINMGMLRADDAVITLTERGMQVADTVTSSFLNA